MTSHVAGAPGQANRALKETLLDWEIRARFALPNSARLGKVFEDFVEVRFFQRDGRLVVTVEGEPLHDALIELDYGVVTVGLWVVPLGDATGRSALFEWVEVTGDVVLQG